MKNTTRTFAARYPIFLDDAVIGNASHTITATGYGAELRFELDSQPATAQQVMNVRDLALSRGTFERVSGPELCAPTRIGKAVAYRLHLQLAGLGYGRGYAVAAEVLGRPVTSLAALSVADAAEVLSYACGSWGLPTSGLVAA